MYTVWFSAIDLTSLIIGFFFCEIIKIIIQFHMIGVAIN